MCDAGVGERRLDGAPPEAAEPEATPGPSGAPCGSCSTLPSMGGPCKIVAPKLRAGGAVWLVCGRPGRSPLPKADARSPPIAEHSAGRGAYSAGSFTWDAQFVGRNPCELLTMDEAQGMQARSEPAGIYAVC